MDDKEKEILKKRKVQRAWANWLSGILIYAGVIIWGLIFFRVGKQEDS